MPVTLSSTTISSGQEVDITSATYDVSDDNLSVAAENASCNGIVDLLDAGAGAGECRIYDGTQPANAKTAVSTQNLLVTVSYNATAAYGAAASGVATANDFTAGTAVASGTATWCRNTDSDGNVVYDDTVTE